MAQQTDIFLSLRSPVAGEPSSPDADVSPETQSLAMLGLALFRVHINY